MEFLKKFFDEVTVKLAILLTIFSITNIGILFDAKFRIEQHLVDEEIHLSRIEQRILGNIEKYGYTFSQDEKLQIMLILEKLNTRLEKIEEKGRVIPIEDRAELIMQVIELYEKRKKGKK